MTDKPKSNRGFASFSTERMREVAAMGGSSVPNEKRSFSQNRDLAKSAGSKGGSASQGGKVRK